jgi:hypothetical protein
VIIDYAGFVDISSGDGVARGYIEMRGNGNANPAASTAKGCTRTFSRSNGIASPNERTEFCAVWEDGSVTVIAMGPAS